MNKIIFLLLLIILALSFRAFTPDYVKVNAEMAQKCSIDKVLYCD